MYHEIIKIGGKFMVDNEKKVREQIFDVIGCLAAAITILVYLVLCIDATWSFIDHTSFVYNVLIFIKTWAPLIVVGIVGLEFTADKNLIIRIIFYVAIAAVVVFMCLPDSWEKVVGVINDKV